MFGHLPNKTEREHFLDVMFELQELSGRFVRDVVMKASNENIMNAMQRCVLTLYSYDENPDDISPENVLRQALELIAKLPLISVKMRCSLSVTRRRDCHWQRISF